MLPCTLLKLSLSTDWFSSEMRHIFFAAVVNSVEKTNDRLSVPITKAEFAVMRTTLSVSFNVSVCYLYTRTIKNISASP